MSTKNETREYLQEKIEEISSIIALEKFDNKPLWARANFDYGRVVVSLAEIDRDVFSESLYEEAIEAFKNALFYYKDNKDNINECATYIAMCRTWRYYALRKGDEAGLAYLKKAEKLLKQALKNSNKEFYLQEVIIKCEYAALMRDFTQLYPLKAHINYLQKSIDLYHEALIILRAKDDYANWQHVLLILGNLYKEIAHLEPKEDGKRNFAKAAQMFESVVQAGPMKGGLAYGVTLAQLELAFLYSKMGNVDKALFYFAVLKDSKLKISAETYLAIGQEKALLLYQKAMQTKNREEKLALLKHAAQIYKTNSKQVELTHNYDILGLIFAQIARLSTVHEEKRAWFEESLNYYNKLSSSCINHINIAKCKAKLGKLYQNKNKELSYKFYRGAYINLNKALRQTNTNSAPYYNIKLKIISLLCAMAPFKKQNSYYRLAQKHLQRVEPAAKFTKIYENLTKEVKNLPKANNFISKIKYALTKR